MSLSTRIRAIAATALSLVATAGTAETVRPRREQPRLRAGYDAAQYDPDNHQHYSAADDHSARAAASPEVRRLLRRRCRHEMANNPTLLGLSMTIANDVVGRGAILQIDEDRNGLTEAEAEQVERAFARWADDVDLAGKLRTARMSRISDGEAFAVFFTNERSPNRVKLDIRLVESDQVATPWGASLDPQNVDGVLLDDNGVPTQYQILKSHPGDFDLALRSLEADTVDAGDVLHWFRATRPGQYRGIPEIASALRLFAQLRRYTAAVLTAAEAAANLAGVIYTETPTDTSEDLESGDEVPLERGTFRTLPAGYKIEQLKAEQPTSTYDQFTSSLLGEAARCVLAPSLIVKGDASGYNYASGRLDAQSWQRAMAVERRDMERVMLRPILAKWLQEAVLIEGLLPPRVKAIVGQREGDRYLEHKWLHEATPHVDPSKEAAANTANLAAGLTTRRDICAENQQDWRDVIRQQAREAKMLQTSDPPLPYLMPGQASSEPANQQADDTTNAGAAA